MLNLYPNEGNYPLPSFMAAQHAPDADPLDEPLTHVQFSFAWLPYVLAALDQLEQYATWAENNDGKLLASMRASTLKEFIATDIPVTVPTPYWDEDSEVDDQVVASDQVWYGEVVDPTIAPTSLTFIERASIWTFTGLLAVAGAVPAALAFSTIAPKFVLAMRQGDFGKVIRVFIDGEEAAHFTDAGDDSVKEITIVPDPSVTPHQIYLTVGNA